MVHRLQPEYLTLFEDFLLAKPWFSTPPPRDRLTVDIWIFGLQHKRSHQLDEGHLCAFESRVIQFGFVEVHHLRVLQLDLAVTVAVVALAAKLEILQHILTEREYCRVISVEIGVDVPLRRLLLLRLVFSTTHDDIVGERWMVAVDAEIVYHRNNYHSYQLLYFFMSKTESEPRNEILTHMEQSITRVVVLSSDVDHETLVRIR